MASQTTGLQYPEPVPSDSSQYNRHDCERGRRNYSSGTHSMRRQLVLANQAWTLHNDDLEVRTSRCGTGNGLYAWRRLRRGLRVYYYGKFYADAAHLQRDHPDDHPEYVHRVRR